MQAYDQAADRYGERATVVTASAKKVWIDAALSMLPPAATILEVGSGAGHDADYLEQQGFTVERR